jgi:hypothetical protein
VIVKKILVSLVSEQTVPNVLMACHYRPDMLWFISTARSETERRTECIKNALRLRGLGPQVDRARVTLVNQDSLTDCLSKVEELLEGSAGEAEYIINITGGNKVMALAAYEVFREIGEKVSIDYMPLSKNEFFQVFPRKKKALQPHPIKDRLRLEEYLLCYGFQVENRNHLSSIKSRCAQRKSLSEWLLGQYGQLEDLLRFLYKKLRDRRKRSKYSMSEEFNRSFTPVESELLSRCGFEVSGNMLRAELSKDTVAYLTGGWFEEAVFNKVDELVEERILDDAHAEVTIKSLGGSTNELDVAFMKDNVFYHIECKTLGTDEEQGIIRDEVYKKGAISSLLGKGDRRAYICTTQHHVKPAHVTKAKDYGIQVLSIHEAIKLQDILRDRFTSVG